MVAHRLIATFDYLDKAFPTKSPELRNRSIVQSIATLAARVVATGRGAGYEERFRAFVLEFMSELSRQVELGRDAADPDYLLFQGSVNAILGLAHVLGMRFSCGRCCASTRHSPNCSTRQ